MGGGLGRGRREMGAGVSHLGFGIPHLQDIFTTERTREVVVGGGGGQGGGLVRGWGSSA